MPKKLYHVKLSADEREYLTKLISSGQERAQAVDCPIAPRPRCMP